MILENRSLWSTDDLRAIISACLVHRGVKNTGLHVRVVHTRGRTRCNGYAYLGTWHPRYKDDDGTMRKTHRQGRWMLLRLPPPEKASETTRVGFARVCEHEVAHLAGLAHTDMGERLYNCTQDVSSWLKELPLHRAEAEVVSIDETRNKKLKAVQHAEQMVAQWERRVRLAQTKLASWKRKLKARGRVVERIGMAAGKTQ